MAKINPNYQKLPGSYLFSEIARRTAAYSQAHPEARLIKMGIGDVTLPLAPAVIAGHARGGGRDGPHGDLPRLRPGAGL